MRCLRSGGKKEGALHPEGLALRDHVVKVASFGFGFGFGAKRPPAFFAKRGKAPKHLHTHWQYFFSPTGNSSCPLCARKRKMCLYAKKSGKGERVPVLHLLYVSAFFILRKSTVNKPAYPLYVHLLSHVRPAGKAGEGLPPLRTLERH